MLLPQRARQPAAFEFADGPSAGGRLPGFQVADDPPERRVAIEVDRYGGAGDGQRGKAGERDRKNAAECDQPGATTALAADDGVSGVQVGAALGTARRNCAGQVVVAFPAVGRLTQASSAKPEPQADRGGEADGGRDCEEDGGEYCRSADGCSSMRLAGLSRGRRWMCNVIARKPRFLTRAVDPGIRLSIMIVGVS